MIRNFLLVGAGGMIGSLLRYAVYLLMRPGIFPLATITVNLVGSLLIGIITGLALRHPGFSNSLRLFLATGICGGFTTFSALSLDQYALLDSGRPLMMVSYLVATVVGGILLTFAGIYLVKLVH